MTKSLFFDSDCISAFLWVGEQKLLTQLYYGQIIIPKEVYTELSDPNIPHIKQGMDSLVNSKAATIYNMETDSAEYKLFYKLTNAPDKGHTIIGDGEAASIALAKEHGGIVASNNLKDIVQYASEFKLNIITTGDILVEAFNKQLITEADGNKMWKKMLNKRRKLGAKSFTEYLTKNKGLSYNAR